MYAELQGKIYANDPDFDTLRGNLVHRHEVTGITRDGWKVRHCVEVIGFGKPPRTVADPDALIAGEGLDLDGRQRKPQRATRELLEEIHDLLYTQPMSAKQMAEATGQTVLRIRGILRDHTGGMVVLQRSADGAVYGLEGRNYDTMLLPPLMKRVLAYLREHGPTATPALYHALDCHKASLQKVLGEYGHLVRRVGTQPAQGMGGAKAVVWDVAGNGHGNSDG